ncbi:MAG: DUF882 domain-containing protein [Nitrospirales bacterium]|nr:DUF882 domain-containing protein [Nitrospirales bacterium]
MISRRNFLKALAAGVVISPFRPRRAMASQEREKILSIFNIHTGESLKIAYCERGVYDPQALDTINHLLRCHYTNEVKPIDVKVLNLLSDIQSAVGRERQVKIISGYRSPEYNDHLRDMGRKGVSGRSLHMQGLAIDFRIPGMGTGELFSLAKSFGVGGVGHYPEFVHIDAGKVRYW